MVLPFNSVMCFEAHTAVRDRVATEIRELLLINTPNKKDSVVLLSYGR